MYYLIFAAFAAVIAGLWLPLHKSKSKKLNMGKLASLLLAAIFAVRYLSYHDAALKYVGLADSPQGGFLTVICALLAWFGLAAVLICVLQAFFKIDTLDNLVKFFALPIFLIGGALLPQMAAFFLGGGKPLGLTGILYAGETAFGIAIGLSVWLRNRCFRLKKRQIFNFLGALLPLILVTMPVYIPQLFLGAGNPRIEAVDFKQAHRLLLYGAFIVPFIIYFALRDKSAETIRFALVFISLATLINYCINYKFDTWLNPLHLPLHLCNTAMFILPLCLIFKWDKLFYFTYFINVLGALLAMLMPNYENVTIFSHKLIEFWLNHYCAFFMPLLMVALKQFPRPKMKQFWYSLIGFAVYFVFIVFINAWFSNYGEVDYFFLNSDFVVKKLGLWAENLRLVILEFDLGGLHFRFYPLYQILFFLVYVGISFAMWFVYEQFFAVADLHYEMSLRSKKIKLDRFALKSALCGRRISAPMYEENRDKLVLNNFGKRYGASKAYAVKNASLEVTAGEIFGFLGPNGAGKSTIIKSIVGIQPITEGSIAVCGYDCEKQPVEAKRNIGYVPDHYALYERLTGREYINYIADIYDVSIKDRNERMQRYVDLFELKDSFDSSMKTYSHGMKQKITIMAALIHDPKLWILDEPLTGLDPNSIFQVKECMKNHAKAGNIVFFSSHIIDVVERICDRITIIKKGKLLCTERVDELERRGVMLEDFYLKTIGESDEAP